MKRDLRKILPTTDLLSHRGARGESDLGKILGHFDAEDTVSKRGIRVRTVKRMCHLLGKIFKSTEAPQWEISQRGSDFFPPRRQSATLLDRVSLREEMDHGGWTNGHLLVHVHEQWGLADSTQLDVLRSGANGVWAGICAEGRNTHTLFSFSLDFLFNSVAKCKILLIPERKLLLIENKSD